MRCNGYKVATAVVAGLMLSGTGVAFAADAPAKPPVPASKAQASATAPASAAKAAAAQAPQPTLPSMTVAQIVDRHVTARGGAAAWKAVQTLAMKGKMGAGASTYEAVSKKLTLERKERPEAQLPFVLEYKRPYRSRLELTFDGQTAVQVFDGKAGFKYRPFLGRKDWQPYSAQELAQASAEPGIDGWLIDASAKGAKVEAAGVDSVEGQPAYKLVVTRKDGQVRRVWIDGKSFLEVREDGEPRKLDGKPRAVTIYLRDYKAEQGLLMPHLIETAVDGVPKIEQINIESVQVNPALDDGRFTKPK
jgi:outer membrane lipoprotein-sorting protein